MIFLKFVFVGLVMFGSRFLHFKRKRRNSEPDLIDTFSYRQ
jgi:hypothetical protein